MTGRSAALLALTLGAYLAGALGQDPRAPQRSYSCSRETELHDALKDAQAQGYSHIALVLPAATVTLTQALELNISVDIVGQPHSGSPLSILACGVPDLGLFGVTLASPSVVLNVSNVEMRDCNRPALMVTPGATGAIHIAGSVFTNFTRFLDRALDLDLVLDYTILNVPSQPTPISPTTMALVIHAPAFAGSLSITNTTFTANAFLDQPAAEEHQGGWTQPPMGEADGPPSLSPPAYSGEGGPQAPSYPGSGGPPGHEGTPPGEEGPPGAYGDAPPPPEVENNEPPPQDPLFDAGAPSTAQGIIRVDRLLLRQANALHPGMQHGPWADDLEAVVAVTCASAAAGAACSVRLEGVRIVGNTGVATSGLYVMCDGANGMTCNVTLTGCTVQDNKLKWQPAVDVERLPLPGAPFVVSSAGTLEDFGTGFKLFAAMMPWLTYTYPIIDYWQKGTIVKNANYVDYLQYLGNVTGRTLGAIVIHQRNSPWPGAPEEQPSMLNVSVTGAEFSGNDGAGFMSTATDWAELAGTPENATEILRHSADITLKDVSLSDHASGFPAVWVRWARNARVTNCTATRTTGAVWLDEVRDEAVVEDSAFVGNPTSPQRFLFFNSFISVAPFEGLDYAFTPNASIGAGMAHLVLIKMSTLGGIINAAIVRDCVFEENGSYMSGTLYILGNEVPTGYGVEDLTTSAAVTLSNTSFARHYCKRMPWGAEAATKCTTDERPALISFVANVLVRGCRFTGNRNGGLITEWISGAATVKDSVFEHNVNTYDISWPFAGQGYGGGGYQAKQIGSGGVRVLDSSFTNNSSPSGGGAVHMREIYAAQFENCNFTDNRAIYGDGGALLLWQSTQTETVATDLDCSIKDSNFTNNVAGRRGGAVAGYRFGLNPGWIIELCRFANNTAMLSPAISSGYLDVSPLRMFETVYADQTGGGAIFAQEFKVLQLLSCTFEGNKVFRHAGGAIRLTDGDRLNQENNVFTRNSAIMGGALAYTRVKDITSAWDSYDSNSAVDPWAWPDTSPVPDSPFFALHPLSAIQPGFGGAIYITGADTLAFSYALNMTNNSALHGGAMAVVRAGGFSLTSNAPDLDAYGYNTPFNFTLPPAVAALPGVPSPFGPSSPGVLPYKALFAHNTALLGGAVYVRDVNIVGWEMSNGYKVQVPGVRNATLVAQGWEVIFESLDLFCDGSEIPGCTDYAPAESRLARSEPAILFFNNTANGGAGLYLDSGRNVSLAHLRFVANTARSPPLAPGFTGLGAHEGRNGTAAGQPCFEGSGGGTCIAGIESSTFLLRRCDFAANSADVNGGALVVAAGRECATLAGCYRAVIDNCTVAGNTAARGTGGAVFWEHEGIAEVASCRDDTRRALQLLGSSPPPAPPPAAPVDPTVDSTPTDPSPTFTLLIPSRKGPAATYAALAADKKAAVLRALAAPAPSNASATAFVLLGPNGTLLLPSASGYASVTSSGPGGVLAAGDGAAGSPSPSPAASPPSSVLMSDGNGTVYRFPLELLRVAGSNPADFNGSFPALQRSVTLVANDSAWQGLPHTQLPCAHWLNNTAAGAEDLGSTPFFLMVQNRTDFYSSNTELGLVVTVHDWLGANSSGAAGSGPEVLVNAVAPEVSGATTVVAANGTALFSGLRMRARQGPHPVTFEGRTAGSVQRGLQSSTVTVYVRPCIVNEFLSPGNQDECLRCKPGAYNFKPTGESCQPCPESAQCGSPEEGSGFLVPTPGYWHVHPFSNQIYECPNSDSCSDNGRGAALAALQVRIWKAIRAVQVNASASALDAALAALSPPGSGFGSGSPTLGHRLRHLRRLAQAASAASPPPAAAAASPPYNGTYDSQAVLTTLAAIIPDYAEGQCADGYTGTLCAECALGWGWTDVATCVKCPARALSALFYSLATLLTLLSLFVTIHASLRAQVTLSSKRIDRRNAPSLRLGMADDGPYSVYNVPPRESQEDARGSGGRSSGGQGQQQQQQQQHAGQGSQGQGGQQRRSTDAAGGQDNGNGNGNGNADGRNSGGEGRADGAQASAGPAAIAGPGGYVVASRGLPSSELGDVSVGTGTGTVTCSEADPASFWPPFGERISGAAVPGEPGAPEVGVLIEREPEPSPEGGAQGLAPADSLLQLTGSLQPAGSSIPVMREVSEFQPSPSLSPAATVTPLPAPPAPPLAPPPPAPPPKLGGRDAERSLPVLAETESDFAPLGADTSRTSPPPPVGPPPPPQAPQVFLPPPVAPALATDRAVPLASAASIAQAAALAQAHLGSIPGGYNLNPTYLPGPPPPPLQPVLSLAPSRRQNPSGTAGTSTPGSVGSPGASVGASGPVQVQAPLQLQYSATMGHNFPMAAGGLVPGWPHQGMPRAYSLQPTGSYGSGPASGPGGGLAGVPYGTAGGYTTSNLGPGNRLPAGGLGRRSDQGTAQSGPGGDRDRAGPNMIAGPSWENGRPPVGPGGPSRYGSGRTQGGKGDGMGPGGGNGGGKDGNGVLPEANSMSRGGPGTGAGGKGGQGGQEQAKTDLPTIIRIFIAYLQVLSLLRFVDLELPEALLFYQGICSQATSYPGMLVSLECALPPKDSTDSAIIRLVITVLAPAYTFAAAALFFFAWNTVKYLYYRRSDSITAGSYASHIASCMRGQMLVALCAIMFFFYPSVCQALMSIFDCQEVSTRDPDALFDGWETQRYWKQDFGTVCYSGAHSGLAYGLGIPGLVLFGFGWPIMSALIMVGRISCCAGEVNFRDLHRRTSDIQATDYKEKWVWWESVVMLRQLAIAAVVTFVGAVGDNSSGTVQLLVVLSILIAASVAQTVVQPYKFVHTDILALLSLYVLLLTVYIMLYLPFTSNDHAISVIVVVLNVLVSCLFVLHIVRTYWRGLLISSGLHEIDEAERKTWTYEQTRKHILHTMMQEEGSKKPEWHANSIRSNRSKPHSADGTLAGSEGARERTSSRFLDRVTEVQRTSVASSKAAVIVLGTSVSRLLELRPSLTGSLKQDGGAGGAQEEERPKKEEVPPTWWGRFLAVLMGRTFDTELDEVGEGEGQGNGSDRRKGGNGGRDPSKQRDERDGRDRR